MKKKITVTAETFSASNFEGNLGDLAQTVENLIKQYGKDAYLNYDKNYYYPYPYDSESTPSYEVRIVREENDEEYQKRLQEENKYRKEIEEREKVEFERLYKKYGAVK